MMMTSNFNPRTDSLHIPSRSTWARMRGESPGDEDSLPARGSRSPPGCQRDRSSTLPSFSSDDLGPRKAAHGLNLLVDLQLRRLIAEDAPEVQQLGGDELVVFRQKADGGALKVAV